VAVFLREAMGRELGARTLRAATQSQRAWELVQQAGQTAHGAKQIEAHDVRAAERALAAADSLLALAERDDPTVDHAHRPPWLDRLRQSRLRGMDRAHNERWIARGIEHADRAIATNPKNADALEVRATLTYWKYLLNLAGTPEEADKLYHDAEHQYREAIAAAGGRMASAQNSLSHLLINKGELAEAKLNALQAYTLDPFLENANLTIWRIFTASWGLGDAVEAKRYCDEGMRRFPEFFRFYQCQVMLAALPGAQNDFTHLWTVLDHFEAASPTQVQDVHRRMGKMYIATGLARRDGRLGHCRGS
jgi:tetratricopeptide (TPR) repeat protein